MVGSNSTQLGLCSLSRTSFITSHLRFLLAVNTLKVILLSYTTKSQLLRSLLSFYTYSIKYEVKFAKVHCCITSGFFLLQNQFYFILLFLYTFLPLLIKTKFWQKVFLYRLLEHWRGGNGELLRLSDEVIPPKCVVSFVPKLIWLNLLFFSQISF